MENNRIYLNVYYVDKEKLKIYLENGMMKENFGILVLIYIFNKCGVCYLILCEYNIF